VIALGKTVDDRARLAFYGAALRIPKKVCNATDTACHGFLEGQIKLARKAACVDVLAVLVNPTDVRAVDVAFSRERENESSARNL